MDLGEHLRVIWRRKWRVAGVAVVIALLVYFRSSSLSEVFHSDAQLSVTSGRATAGESGAQQDTLFLAATYAARAETDPVLQDAIARAKLSLTPDEARGRIDVTASTEVGFLTITTTGPTPSAAQVLAQGEAEALIAVVDQQQQEDRDVRVAPFQAQIDDVQRQLAEVSSASPEEADALRAQYAVLLSQKAAELARPLDRLEVIQPAAALTSPVAPTPKRDAALALIVALIVNAELAVLIEALSGRFSVEDIGEELPKATGLPILARIPRGDGPEVVEAFRTLRTNLMFLNSRAQVRTLAVVGVEPGCGKSHTAIGLATAAADLELPVVLIDADLRRPVIHQRLRISSRPGLGDLRSKDDLERVARPVFEHEHLKVIPAGSKVDDPSSLLGGGFREVLLMINFADLIVVDTPAAGLFAEATAIAAQCDATIVVLDATNAKRRQVIELVESLRRVTANPVGIVLNKVDPGPRTAAYYYDRPEEGRVRSSR
jgi:capsular exopolysaccharide synthesis family protein